MYIPQKLLKIVHYILITDKDPASANCRLLLYTGSEPFQLTGGCSCAPQRELTALRLIDSGKKIYLGDPLCIYTPDQDTCSQGCRGVPTVRTFKISFLLTVTDMDLCFSSHWISLDLVPSATSTSMYTSSMVWPHWPQSVRQYTTPLRSSKWDIFHVYTDQSEDKYVKIVIHVHRYVWTYMGPIHAHVTSVLEKLL